LFFAGVSASTPKIAQALRRLLNEYPMPFVNTYRHRRAPRDLFNCYAGSLGIFQNQPGDRLLKKADVVITVDLIRLNMTRKHGTKAEKGRLSA